MKSSTRFASSGLSYLSSQLDNTFPFWHFLLLIPSFPMQVIVQTFSLFSSSSTEAHSVAPLVEDTPTVVLSVNCTSCSFDRAFLSIFCASFAVINTVWSSVLSFFVQFFSWSTPSSVETPSASPSSDLPGANPLATAKAAEDAAIVLISGSASKAAFWAASSCISFICLWRSLKASTYLSTPSIILSHSSTDISRQSFSSFRSCADILWASSKSLIASDRLSFFDAVLL